jgi:hypothetical protein
LRHNTKLHLANTFPQACTENTVILHCGAC